VSRYNFIGLFYIALLENFSGETRRFNGVGEYSIPQIELLAGYADVIAKLSARLVPSEGRGHRFDPRRAKRADRRTNEVSVPRRGEGRRPESLIAQRLDAAGAPEGRESPKGDSSQSCRARQ
jgi:hypothetical protein